MEEALYNAYSLPYEKERESHHPSFWLGIKQGDFRGNKWKEVIDVMAMTDWQGVVT